MSDLQTFQKAFAAAIISDEQPEYPFRSLAFTVYRNTSARGAVEALRATYSTVNQLLGDDSFTQVALAYRAECPPRGPVLSEYGADFSNYLARQPWTCELPYLADVARLDWLWLESFLAGDADRITPNRRPQIRLHPAVRFVRLATPALTIWQAHRDPCEFEQLEPEWCEEIALFTRPGLEVRTQQIDRATHYLLLVAACSPSVDRCVTAVAETHPQSNVPELLQQCVAAGALIIP